MAQHLLLIVVAAPLLAAGQPAAFLWALPLAWRGRAGRWWRERHFRAFWRGLSHPAVVLVLFVALLWGWHVPALYQAALGNEAIHALEHVCFLGSALLLWWTVIHAGRHGGMGHGVGVVYVFVAGMPSTLLGALFTFSQAPWYPAYRSSVQAWHLTALQDQQLAGLIMWVPSGFVYLGITCILFANWLRYLDRHHAPTVGEDRMDQVAYGREAVADHANLTSQRTHL